MQEKSKQNSQIIPKDKLRNVYKGILSNLYWTRPIIYYNYKHCGNTAPPGHTHRWGCHTGGAVLNKKILDFDVGVLDWIT